MSALHLVRVQLFDNTLRLTWEGILFVAYGEDDRFLSSQAFRQFSHDYQIKTVSAGSEYWHAWKRPGR